MRGSNRAACFGDESNEKVIIPGLALGYRVFGAEYRGNGSIHGISIDCILLHQLYRLDADEQHEMDWL